MAIDLGLPFIMMSGTVILKMQWVRYATAVLTFSPNQSLDALKSGVHRLGSQGKQAPAVIVAITAIVHAEATSLVEQEVLVQDHSWDTGRCAFPFAQQIAPTLPQHYGRLSHASLDG